MRRPELFQFCSVRCAELFQLRPMRRSELFQLCSMRCPEHFQLCCMCRAKLLQFPAAGSRQLLNLLLP
ncbi:hypothetical protein D3C73_1440810 [compost metagenome]